MADMTYMDCWHYIAPLIPITSDRMTTEIYVMVFQALKEAEERRYVQNLPAADVAPVVHGRWAHLGGDEWCCSACGFVVTTEGSWDTPTKKYCEDCGARMDGDVE